MRPIMSIMEVKAQLHLKAWVQRTHIIIAWLTQPQTKSKKIEKKPAALSSSVNLRNEVEWQPWAAWRVKGTEGGNHLVLLRVTRQEMLPNSGVTETLPILKVTRSFAQLTKKNLLKKYKCREVFKNFAWILAKNMSLTDYKNIRKLK